MTSWPPCDSFTALILYLANFRNPGLQPRRVYDSFLLPFLIWLVDFANYQLVNWTCILLPRIIIWSILYIIFSISDILKFGSVLWFFTLSCFFLSMTLKYGGHVQNFFPGGSCLRSPLHTKGIFCPLSYLPVPFFYRYISPEALNFWYEPNNLQYLYIYANIFTLLVLL